MNNKLKDILASYVDAYRPIIYINHFDFLDIKETIHAVNKEVQCLEYDYGLGPCVQHAGETFARSCNSEASLPDFLKSAMDIGYTNELFVILKDINGELGEGGNTGTNQNAKVIAMLKNIAERTLYGDDYHTTVFILSDTLTIPHELENLITVVDYPLPQQKEIKALINNFAKDYNFCVDAKVVDSLAVSLKGLSDLQIKQILYLACQDGLELTAEHNKLINKEKEQFIRKSGMLEIMSVKENADDIGGLKNLKEWLEKKAKILSRLEEAKAYGVDVPKGILIVGKPGCGKSLTAKATANMFKLPLVRMDVGNLLGKYIGESENKMRKALKLAESFSPCVLWVDEIEKAFMGFAGDESGVIARLFGQLLTWMQEKESSIFIVATANNIEKLPPEFLRKGRFDELFYVDKPNENERRHILSIHLKKRHKKIPDDDLRGLAEVAKGYSGSELEAIVKDAIEECFIQSNEIVSISDLKAARLRITPLNPDKDDEDTKALIKKYGFKKANK